MIFFLFLAMQALGGQTLGVPQIILCTPSMGGGQANPHLWRDMQVKIQLSFALL